MLLCVFHLPSLPVGKQVTKKMHERVIGYSMPICITVADTVSKYVFLQVI